MSHVKTLEHRFIPPQEFFYAQIFRFSLSDFKQFMLNRKVFKKDTDIS